MSGNSCAIKLKAKKKNVMLAICFFDVFLVYKYTFCPAGVARGKIRG